MNKNLHPFFLCVVMLGAFSSYASWKEGYYLGVMGGYSKITGKVKDSNEVMLSGQNRGSVSGKSSAKGSYVAGVSLGHRATFGKRHFSAELGVSYANAHSKVGDLTANATHAPLGLVNGTRYPLHYTPKLGVSAAIRVGYLFKPTLLGYVKVGAEQNIGDFIVKAGKKTKVGVNVTNLVPGLGVEGKLSERMYWMASFDYKLAIKASQKTKGFGFTKRPRELVGKAGLGYAF